MINALRDPPVGVVHAAGSFVHPPREVAAGDLLVFQLLGHEMGGLLSGELVLCGVRVKRLPLW